MGKLIKFDIDKKWNTREEAEKYKKLFESYSPGSFYIYRNNEKYCVGFDDPEMGIGW